MVVERLARALATVAKAGTPVEAPLSRVQRFGGTVRNNRALVMVRVATNLAFGLRKWVRRVKWANVPPGELKTPSVPLKKKWTQRISLNSDGSSHVPWRGGRVRLTRPPRLDGEKRPVLAPDIGSNAWPQSTV